MLTDTLTPRTDDAPIPPAFRVLQVRWQDQAAALGAVRTRVFIEEQQIPPEDEWDVHDATCDHLLALAVDGQPIGTARLFASGRIGRLAVLADWRGRGVGRALLQAALNLALLRQSPEICLDAQTHALAFYAGLGFVAEGDLFMDAGIPHQRMVYSATQANASM